ncbi:MAG: type II toxin-antitoxin system VapC family toxin [Candidatus Korobacteraceae bacterium]
MRPPAFWDSSALVPLCLREPLTNRALALHKQYQPVVWWGTSLEIAAALARLLRIRQVDVAAWTQAKLLAKKLSDDWTVIQPSENLRTQAEQILENYDLRAADSLQFAAALIWCEGSPQQNPFITADRRLRDAAQICGFQLPSL